MPRPTTAENGGFPDRQPEYWDVRDIQFHCRMGRSTAWRLVRENGFPAPVVHGKRCILWPRSEVIAFLERRRSEEHYRVGVGAIEPERPRAMFSTRAVRTGRNGG